LAALKALKSVLASSGVAANKLVQIKIEKGGMKVSFIVTPNLFSNRFSEKQKGKQTT